MPEHSGNGRTVGVLALFKQSSIDPLIEQGGGGTVHVFTKRATDFRDFSPHLIQGIPAGFL